MTAIIIFNRFKLKILAHIIKLDPSEGVKFVRKSFKQFVLFVLLTLLIFESFLSTHVKIFLDAKT